MPETAAWSWPAVPTSVGCARRAVLDYLSDAEAPRPPLRDVALALSEAVTNAVLHAYLDMPAGEVRVSIAYGPDDVLMTVEDDGRGLLPRGDSPGLGIGLPLISELADRVETRTRPGAGLTLRAWFPRRPKTAAVDA